MTQDGLMVVSTPNPESVGAQRKGRDWFAYRDETHISIHQIRDWRLAFTEAGFVVERDGTDFLWDPPYVDWIPRGIQRIAWISAQWLMTWAVGFLAWKAGENYVAILRKGASLPCSRTSHIRVSGMHFGCRGNCVRRKPASSDRYLDEISG